MSAEKEFTLRELAGAAGVTPRTVRYYIAQGLLPSPGRLGAHTRYGADHLRRLGQIKSLQDEDLTLAEIRGRVTAVEDFQLPNPIGTSATPEGSRLGLMSANTALRDPANSTARSQWERIVLSPDLELHVRSPRTPATDRRVRRILALHRDLTSPG